MKRVALALSALVPIVALSACDDGYGYGGYGGGIAYASRPYAYNGYYDGFYGPIFDGYWGTDNFFYYRRGDRDRRFYRGDRDHFDRERGRGDNWREMRGSFTPQRGYQMPYFGGDRSERHGGRGRDRGGDRGRDRPR